MTREHNRYKVFFQGLHKIQDLPGFVGSLVGEHVEEASSLNIYIYIYIRLEKDCFLAIFLKPIYIYIIYQNKQLDIR